eukprot:m.344048 g.344048  ORF g.344048 m.344048 type:complete len:254 (+) comp16133_c0_seq15:100-861(+)
MAKAFCVCCGVMTITFCALCCQPPRDSCVGLPFAITLVSFLRQSRKLSHVDTQVAEHASASNHDESPVKNTRVLGVDLSTVVHTLLGKCYCVAEYYLASLDLCGDSSPEFDALEKVFDTAAFERDFCVFVSDLLSVRPNVCFVADGTPPPHKQQHTQCSEKLRARASTLNESIHLRNILGSLPDDYRSKLFRDACGSVERAKMSMQHASSRWFVSLAWQCLASYNCERIQATGEAEQHLVHLQRTQKIHDILC